MTSKATKGMSSEKKTLLLGICGVYCGACTTYRAYNDNDQALFNRNVKMGMPPDQIFCKGCSSDVINEWCANCDFRKCVKGRGIAYCFECEDFPCKKLIDFSIHSFKEDIERSKVAIYAWGSWFDSETADGVIRRFLTFSNIQRAVIGPWSHGAAYHASPYLPMDTPVDPSVNSQLLECLCFFDYYLKDIDSGAMSEKVLIYYTLGEEKWKTTNVWPPKDSTTQRWYLAADNILSQRAPKAKSGADKFTVDFESTTGKANRWHTLLGGSAVVYPDRAEEDSRLLTYTSSPLAEDTEITGYPVVTLYLTSTTTDGAFFVYLEDVDKTGKVTYITEGMLRAIHRKVSTDSPSYNLLVPYHSFKRKDAMPLVPGEVAKLTFGLLPTSVLIKKEHKMRIAIAGHDKDTFTRIPAEGTPVITIARNKLHASFVDLPVVQRR